MPRPKNPNKIHRYNIDLTVDEWRALTYLARQMGDSMDDLQPSRSEVVRALIRLAADDTHDVRSTLAEVFADLGYNGSEIKEPLPSWKFAREAA